MARSKKKNPETKNKEDAIVVPGQVVECLPQTKFRVLLETGQEIIAYTSGRLYRFRIRILLGDKVLVELSPYDLSKGRIVRREKQ